MMDPSLAISLASASLMAVRTMVRHESTRAENLPLHHSRDQILRILRDEPGTNISQLCTLTGRKWGTLQYHLRLLERASLVTSRSYGRERKFFPMETAPGEFEKVALLRRGRIRNIVGEILRGPGQVQQDLTRKTGLTRKVFGNYRDLLTRAGLLTEIRAGKTRRYYPTAELAKAVQSAHLGPSPDFEDLRPGSKSP